MNALAQIVEGLLTKTEKFKFTSEPWKYKLEFEGSGKTVVVEGKAEMTIEVKSNDGKPLVR